MFIDPNIFFLYIYIIMTRRRTPKRACLQIVLFIISLLHFGVVEHSAELLMGACLLAITHFTFGHITLCACLDPNFINELYDVAIANLSNLV